MSMIFKSIEAFGKLLLPIFSSRRQNFKYIVFVLRTMNTHHCDPMITFKLVPRQQLFRGGCLLTLSSDRTFYCISNDSALSVRLLLDSPRRMFEL